jgi:hypothetical protein
VLHGGGEEGRGLDFLPEVKAGLVPIGRDVVEVELDGGPEGIGNVRRGGVLEEPVCIGNQRGATQSRAVFGSLALVFCNFFARTSLRPEMMTSEVIRTSNEDSHLPHDPVNALPSMLNWKMSVIIAQNAVKLPLVLRGHQL